jgi:hypothetical protein
MLLQYTREKLNLMPPDRKLTATLHPTTEVPRYRPAPTVASSHLEVLRALLKTFSRYISPICSYMQFNSSINQQLHKHLFSQFFFPLFFSQCSDAKLKIAEWVFFYIYTGYILILGKKLYNQSEKNKYMICNNYFLI